MSTAKEKGYAGETIAADFLVQHGYQILRRNFYSKFGELDLVSQDPDGVLVFCEVKSFQPNSLVDPLLAITRSKIKKLLKTIRYYQLCFDTADQPSRVDVIVVENGRVREHLVNVVLVS